VGFIALLFASCVAVGAAVNRWWAVPLPAVGFVTYVLGRREGWWGCCGVGEGWWAAMIAASIVGTAGFATGVTLRRARRRY
jgi:hypothetical protein